MKKIIAALILLLGVLVVPVVAAAPAEAACVYSFRSSLANAKIIETRNIGDDSGTTHAGWYKVYGQLWYYACGTHANVDKYRVVIDNTSGHCGWIDYWHVNPNVIGNWNPGEKTTNCNNEDTDYLLWDATNVVGIEPDDPSNERCIGGNIEADINNHPNDTYAVPTVCLTF